MSFKNLALNVESIALCLSEEGGYEYYDIDDDLKELAKNVSDMEAENAKLRKMVYSACSCIERFCVKYECDGCPLLHDEMEPCDFAPMLANMRVLGIEVGE